MGMGELVIQLYCLCVEKFALIMPMIVQNAQLVHIIVMPVLCNRKAHRVISFVTIHNCCSLLYAVG